jgi:hypothetical protein
VAAEDVLQWSDVVRAGLQRRHVVGGLSTPSITGRAFVASLIDPPSLLVCDADTDGDVDLVDIQQIRSATRTPASAGDPRDRNGDPGRSTSRTSGTARSA